MPFIPEREVNRNENFFDNFYKHLNEESSSMVMENGERCEGTDLIGTYKYIFNSPIDWTGPLNYFRNLFFYRVKANVSVM